MIPIPGVRPRAPRASTATRADVLTKLATALLAAAVLAIGSLAGAGAASAHTTRIAAEPAENTVLTQSPQRVAATFNEELQPQFAAMTVVGPDGNLWSMGDPQVQGTAMSVAVRPLGPAGQYTVNYRVTSADGHVVTGSWSFQFTVPSTDTPGQSAAPTPPPPPPPPPAGAIPMWPFAVGAVAIVGGAALWAVRRQR